jgi:hypothetical protein
MFLAGTQEFAESSAMDPFFTELGRTVLARWSAQNFSPALFPAIARTALEENSPADHVDIPALIQDFLLEDEHPFQSQSSFGQPELIVFDHPRFYIQILFWLDGTTDIHQHMFSGAFHVLQGSSIHSQFEFENRQPVSAHLQVGKLRLKHTELLETGRTEEITSGTGYIHSLFHLESPSMTVVIRTHTDPGSAPQFTYLPPHLAVDPIHNDSLTTRRKELLDVLERIDEPSYGPVVLEMLRRLDFERGFFILQNGMGHLHALGALDEALEVFAQKHGPLADGVGPTLHEIVRRDGLVAFRNDIEDPEHRFFLALLLNVPNREGILQMIAQRIPGRPEDTVLRWAEELSETTEQGTTILDAVFPEALKVAPDKQLEVFLEELRYFLGEGRDSDLRNSTRANPSACEGEMNGLRAALARSSLMALGL